MTTLTEAFAAIEAQDAQFYAPEINRLKGELLLKRDTTDTTEAQNCFEQAIQIAKRQEARSYELRATTGLARLLASRGCRQEAWKRLSEIYNWFTEGFDTADLKDAKALLEELNI
jgi:hypothetical protein